MAPTIQVILERLQKNNDYTSDTKQQLVSAIKKTCEYMDWKLYQKTIYTVYDNFDLIVKTYQEKGKSLNYTTTKIKHLNMILNRILNDEEKAEIGKEIREKWLMYLQNVPKVKIEDFCLDLEKMESDTSSESLEEIESQSIESEIVEETSNDLLVCGINTFKVLMERKRKIVEDNVYDIQTLVNSLDILKKSKKPIDTAIDAIKDIIRDRENDNLEHTDQLKQITNFLNVVEKFQF